MTRRGRSLSTKKLVSSMIKSGARATGLLHKVTKPTAGRVQILKEEEKDAKPSAICEETRKEWAKHWQCDTEVQHLEDRPWRNKELKSLEEGTPRLKKKELEKAATTCQAKTGVGCDGFHVQVPLNLSKETRGAVVAAIRLSLFPKIIGSERPVSKERLRWCLFWQKHLGKSACQWCGRGRHTVFFPGRFYVFHAGISSVRGVHNWKDVWRSHSRPSGRFFRGLNGVAYRCALCCRMR